MNLDYITIKQSDASYEWRIWLGRGTCWAPSIDNVTAIPVGLGGKVAGVCHAPKWYIVNVQLYK